MNRSPLEIIAILLHFTEKEKRKTSIMHHCNLSYKTATKTINLLTEKGLIEKNQEYYCTTADGTQFIEKYREIENLLNKTPIEKKPTAKHPTK